MEQLNEFYSDQLCCLLMLMLQWESEKRPDFVALRVLLPNILALDTAEANNFLRMLIK